MKIALILPGGVDPSGVERVVPAWLWQIERLARVHELHVFALRQPGAPAEYPLLGATVHNLGVESPLAAVGALLSALRRRGRFDVLHAFWAGTPGLAACIAGRRFRVPVIVSIAGGELVAYPEIGYGGALRCRNRMVVRSTLRLAARVTVASGGLEAQLRAIGVPEGRVVRVPLGVPRDRFTPAERPPDGPWRLLHVASLNRVKDQGTLLAAFARIVRRLPEVRLDVVGEDTLGGVLVRQAEEMELDGRVHFAGWRPSTELPDWYRRAHLHLLTSRHEAGPVAVLEAAACGVATVGTHVGHVEDLAPSAAVSVPVGDAEALADAALELLQDDCRRRQIADAARTFALEHDADRTAARFESIYREVTA